jgi:hypothetical protein
LKGIEDENFIFSIISIYNKGQYPKIQTKTKYISAFAVRVKDIKFIWKVVVERAAVIDHIMKIRTRLVAPKL